MATITVKNILEDPYERLKKAVGIHKIDVETEIARAHELREKTGDYFLTDDEINKAKAAGRP